MALQFPNSPQQPSNQPQPQTFDNSPYLAPQANMGHYTSFSQQYNDGRIFSLSGRIGRVQYIAYPLVFAFVVMGISFVVLMLFGGIGAILSQKSADVGIATLLGGYVILVLGASLASFAFFVIHTIRRLHDMNRSGWLSLLMFIPVVNLLMVLALWFIAGTDGENDYGLPPEPPSTLLKIVAGVMIAVNVGVVFLGMAMVSIAEKYAQVQEQTEIIAEGVAQAQIDAQNAQNVNLPPEISLPAENQPQPVNNQDNLNTETIVFTAEDLAQKNPNGVILPQQNSEQMPVQPVDQPIQPTIQAQQPIQTAPVMPNNSEIMMQPEQAEVIIPPEQGNIQPSNNNNNNGNNNNGGMSYEEFMKMSEKPVFSDR